MPQRVRRQSVQPLQLLPVRVAVEELSEGIAYAFEALISNDLPVLIHAMFDLSQHRLSIDSPMGRALLGKTLDQSFDLETPEGVQHWIVVDIAYDP